MQHATSFSCLGDPNAAAKHLLQRAHNQDGLPEMFVGLFLLLNAGLAYAQLIFPKHSIGSRIAYLACSIVVPAICLSGQWAINSVRRRYLITRFGYVQYSPLRQRKIVMAMVIAIVTALFGWIVVSKVNANLVHQDQIWLIVLGLLGGGFIALVGRLPRFVVGGIVTVLLGVILAFLGTPRSVGFGIFFAVVGCFFLVSGSVVFIRFIRKPVEGGE